MWGTPAGASPGPSRSPGAPDNPSHPVGAQLPPRPPCADGAGLQPPPQALTWLCPLGRDRRGVGGGWRHIQAAEVGGWGKAGVQPTPPGCCPFCLWPGGSSRGMVAGLGTGRHPPHRTQLGKGFCGLDRAGMVRQVPKCPLNVLGVGALAECVAPSQSLSGPHLRIQVFITLIHVVLAQPPLILHVDMGVELVALGLQKLGHRGAA